MSLTVAANLPHRLPISIMKATISRSICLAIAACFLASCAEPPPPPPPQRVYKKKSDTPEDFRAVEKPSTYSR